MPTTRVSKSLTIIRGILMINISVMNIYTLINLLCYVRITK